MSKNPKKLFLLSGPLPELNAYSPNVYPLQALLEQYGYLTESCCPGRYDEPTRDALNKFQECCSSGDDISYEETIKRLCRARCGVSDNSAMTASTLPVVHSSPPITVGSIWLQDRLYFQIEKPTADFALDGQRDIFEKAFSKWGEITGLEFKQTNGENKPDITLAFHKGEHDDGFPFDEAGTPNGNMAAHAFPPPPIGGRFAGSIHFDDAELWKKDESTAEGVSLFAIAFHEIGHALGMGHSQDPHSVMYPFYNENLKDFTEKDKEMIKSLYGLRKQARLVAQPEDSQTITLNLGIEIA
ncbi:MAG: hypothetical protein NPIRA01_16710 [Nitrospirales bacterium]|nr:MAG: hypothetical protein NPIRA01_16710 [Nitrospirales bacterium]